MGTPNKKNGTSPRATSLAKRIDRLPPGDYVIKLEKHPNRNGGISYEISRTQKVATAEGTS